MLFKMVLMNNKSCKSLQSQKVWTQNYTYLFRSWVLITLHLQPSHTTLPVDKLLDLLIRCFVIQTKFHGDKCVWINEIWLYTASYGIDFNLNLHLYMSYIFVSIFFSIAMDSDWCILSHASAFMVKVVSVIWAIGQKFCFLFLYFKSFQWLDSIYSLESLVEKYKF